MKSFRDEIRLRREIRTDLISSAKQISSEQSEDFIALCAISLKNEQSCSIIQLDKLEFVELITHYFYLLLPQFCSVWLLFRRKETSFVYQDKRGFLCSVEKEMLV